MTFSIVAQGDDGEFGMAVSSSSPAVAARCIHLESGIGVVASQNITDPRLGVRGLELLRRGIDAEQATATLVGAELNIDYRQLCVIDSQGRTATYSGKYSLGSHSSAQGDRCCAAGNLLADEHIPDTMVKAFMQADGDLEVRLLAALRAAVAAGGEAGPVRSAGLVVIADQPWPRTDLRVDDHDDPLTELTRILEVWLPQRDAYLTRALHPGQAPSFNVAGDR